jgi:hypothetical protein
VRYDIVSVLDIGGETEVKHFEDAFYWFWDCRRFLFFLVTL